MKSLLVVFILFVFATPLRADQKMPADIERAFVKNNPYLSREDAMTMDDPRFVEYILKNWKSIAEEIEILPEVEGNIPGEGVAFNASVMAFSETCQKLPPMEYVDFLDQMLILYEQRRISDKAFARVILAELEKRSFLSVNYEHPRVATLLKKAIRLTPTKNVSLKSCLEDMAKGDLADNYMTDRSDDDSMPETLPGIKLKRPWGSLIPKIEKLTGKKVPPDSNFPEDSLVRTRQRPGSNGHEESKQETGLFSMSRLLSGGLAGLLAVGIAWMIARWRRKRR